MTHYNLMKELEPMIEEEGRRQKLVKPFNRERGTYSRQEMDEYFIGGEKYE